MNEWAAEWAFSDASTRSPVQTNGYDCGVFTIVSMYLLSQGHVLTPGSYSQATVARARIRMNIASLIHSENERHPPPARGCTAGDLSAGTRQVTVVAAEDPIHPGTAVQVVPDLGAGAYHHSAGGVRTEPMESTRMIQTWSPPRTSASPPISDRHSVMRMAILMLSLA